MNSAIDLHKASWRRSTRSAGNGNCVEVACIHTAPWRKSTRSQSNGDCVEVAPVASTIAVRDSKLPTSGNFPHLLVDTTIWSGLLAAIKTGGLALTAAQPTEPAPPPTGTAPVLPSSGQRRCAQVQRQAAEVG